MEIKLAGFNVETEQMDNIHKVDKKLLTPEIFSSAYARISRSKKSITELRSDARSDVEKARKSNKKIIFDMGHHSVAEHAVFNFDLIDISRLALESIERFRLVSYTEKSQRYVTLKGDFHIPNEFTDQKLKKRYLEIINLQNDLYNKLFKLLKDYIFSKHANLASDKKNKSLLEGWAKEDARYILSLATFSQLGMTINARNLEHMFRYFALSKIHEVKEVGVKLYDIVEKIAPSIILFPEPSIFESDISSVFNSNFEKHTNIDISLDPKIIEFQKDGDDRILASFLSIFNSMDFNSSLNKISSLPFREKRNIYLDLFKNMEFFDTPPRNFEFSDITFQVVVSASNFAQLKRHRMTSLLQSDYEIKLGNTVPENIKNICMDNKFTEVIKETNAVFSDLKDKFGSSADYILTNSHRKNVIMKMNLREAFHFIRLRSDKHAQWDIKDLSDKLLIEIKKIFPLSAMLLCGKHDFIKNFEKVYDRKPKFNI